MLEINLSCLIMCCLVNVTIEIFLQDTRQEIKYKIVYVRHEAHSLNIVYSYLHKNTTVI